MELTSKQRAQLRAMCNTLPVVLYIGKDGITDATVKEAWDALEARELIKCSVQRGAPFDAREACQTLCGRVHAEPVQCIGNKFSIYRESRENPVITLL
ncbi:MAG: YhbY family RNA-binding protein [Clostridiales bacterium]|nr:YhbY family RNA-binding protein [Clostridiales bacterium]